MRRRSDIGLSISPLVTDRALHVQRGSLAAFNCLLLSYVARTGFVSFFVPSPTLYIRLHLRAHPQTLYDHAPPVLNIFRYFHRLPPKTAAAHYVTRSPSSTQPLSFRIAPSERRSTDALVNRAPVLRVAAPHYSLRIT